MQIHYYYETKKRLNLALIVNRKKGSIIQIKQLTK
jgi:hypothetical protein